MKQNETKPVPRVLKVEEVGDHWRKRTIPRIRLKGKWLQAAGIQPNSYVQIEILGPGRLHIQSLDRQTE